MGAFTGPFLSIQKPITLNYETSLDLLIVEDHAPDLFLIRELLAESGLPIHAIHEASTLKDAHTLINTVSIDLVLLDLTLPDSDGMHSYFSIRELYPKIPVIILTGVSNGLAGFQAIQYGVQDYLVKGEYTAAMLEKAIRYSIERMYHVDRLRRSEEKYRLLFNQNPFPALIFDAETFRILEVNNAAMEAYGYTRQEFAKLDIFAIRMTEYEDSLVQAIWDNNGAAVTEKNVPHKKKNGEMMVVEGAYFFIDYMDKPAVQAQIYDITEKVKLELLLQEERRQKRRELKAAILEAQEKERKAIGQEIHDNVNQIITAAGLHIELVHSGNAPLSQLSRALELNRIAIEENRKLSRALILPQLQGAGLIVSLHDLRKELMQSSSLNIKFAIDSIDEDAFKDEEKVSLYRIVQEQLNNIIKYAEARSVLIRLYQQDEAIILSIKDNGKGFDPQVRSKGVGLMNIRNRAEVLQGSMQIDSAAGRGCTLRVVMNRRSVA